MRFRQRLIYPQSLQGGLFGSRGGHCWRTDTEKAIERIAVGQSGPRRPVAVVLVDRLLKCTWRHVWSVCLVLRFHKSRPLRYNWWASGFSVERFVSSFCSSALVARRSWSDTALAISSWTVMRSANVRSVLAPPQLGVLRNVHELRLDVDAVAPLNDSSHQDCAHSQFTADRSEIGPVCTEHRVLGTTRRRATARGC